MKLRSHTKRKRARNDEVQLRTPTPPPAGEKMARSPTRARFIAAAEEHHRSGQVKFTTLCEKFNISASTGYRWLRAGGARATANLSRRGRKPAFTEQDARVVQTWENATQDRSYAVHLRVARSLGYKCSAGTIERRMRQIGVYLRAAPQGRSPGEHAQAGQATCEAATSGRQSKAAPQDSDPRKR